MFYSLLIDRNSVLAFYETYGKNSREIRMKEFVLKSLVVTACLCFLLLFFMPRYISHPEHGNKMNVITGKVYYWDDTPWRK